MCDIWQVLDVMMCTSSIMHMCTISLDRYIAIRHPLKNRNKSRTVVGIKIATVWFISLAIASPIIMLSLLDPENVLSQNTCAIFNQYFLIYGSLGAFFIPLIIMLIAYSLTIHLLNSQAKLCAEKSKSGAPVIRRSISKRRRSHIPMLRSRERRAHAEKPSVNGLSLARKIQSHLDRNNAHPSETEPLHKEGRCETENSTANSSPTQPFSRLSQPSSRQASRHGQNSPVRSPRLQALVMKHSAAIKVASVLIAKSRDSQTKKTMNTVKTERKAVKVLGTMFAIFVLSWGPFFSLNFAMGVCESCNIDVALFKVFLWLGYVSSTLNPIIYTIFNKTFKRTFIRILQCKFYTRKIHKLSSINRNGGGGSIRMKYDATATTHPLQQNESMVWPRMTFCKGSHIYSSNIANRYGAEIQSLWSLCR